MSPVVQGVLRHALTMVGGFLVAQGYIDDQQLGVLVGAVLSIGGIALSVLEKKARA